MMVKRVTPVSYSADKDHCLGLYSPTRRACICKDMYSYSDTQGKFIAMPPKSQRVCLLVRGKTTLSHLKTVSILLTWCSENVGNSDSGRESGAEESFHWLLTIASD